MSSPERIRRSVRRNVEDSSEGKSDRVRDEQESEGDDKRKHRSSKSKKSGSGAEAEVVDRSGRKRSSGEKMDSQKQSGGSTRDDVEEEDFDLRQELRAKQLKKIQEESQETALESLSNWYQDGEIIENKHDIGDKSGSKGHGRASESDKGKSIPKTSDRKGKDERSLDAEGDKTQDKESRYSERKELSREKGHGSSEQGRNQRKRWADTDTDRIIEESKHVEIDKSDLRTGKYSDSKNESSRERSMPTKTEPREVKSRDLDLTGDKSVKSHGKEEIRADHEKHKSKSSVEGPKEIDKGIPLMREDTSRSERLDEHREQIATFGQDIIESHDRSSNIEEDGSSWMRDKSRGETERSNRSRTPERSGRHRHEPDQSEVDFDRNSTFRRKEHDKDGYRDERLKARDDSWSDRNRDREGSKDNWKRRQPNITDKDIKDSGTIYDHGREWELQRRGRERTDNERPLGRVGGRKDWNRTEAVKTSSNYGISNENYDVIEIQTKPFDYAREESRSTFVKNSEVNQQSDIKLGPNDQEFAYPRENRARNVDVYGSGQYGEDVKDRHTDDGPATQDQIWRDDIDFQAGKGRGQQGSMLNRTVSGQTSSSGSQPPHGNQGAGSFSRGGSQGVKGNRMGRGGRGRPGGKDSQQVGIQVPMMPSPFGQLGMPPPGALQPLTPSMSPGAGPPISPGIFMPPFSPPVIWPGPRGMEMNMLAVPPGLSTIPPGPVGPRFFPLGTPPSPAMYFNQTGPGRGVPPNMSGPGFNAMSPMGHGQPQDKASVDWVPSRTNGPRGKAPSRGEQNDYSQNFVDTGMRPQNYIRELELTSVVEDYPRLRELIQKKDEIVANSATAPMYYKCDLREQVLSHEFFGTKFDVILVDPPWEEYVHRAPGVTDHMDYWTLEEIMNLKIEAIADTPSFIFLWVGDGVGLEQGRQCLKKWGFRRCEDICWVKTNKTNATPGLRHDSHTLFQRSKEHCLMGIKGTVRRSTDGHIIHANIDTDVIIAEEPPYGSTAKPEDMYRIIEHFSLGRRRLELFGEDHNIRSGWLTVGKDLSSSNFNSEAYVRNFADKDGKVWQGGGGRNPPPEAGHLVLTTPDIESLRPKSPMKNQQQLQQQHSNSISLTTGNSSNRRPTGNSPTHHSAPTMNQEVSSSNFSVPVPWDAFKGGSAGPDDRHFDMYGFNGSFG